MQDETSEEQSVNTFGFQIRLETEKNMYVFETKKEGSSKELTVKIY